MTIGFKVVSAIWHIWCNAKGIAPYRLRREVEKAALPHPVDGIVTVSVGTAVFRPASWHGSTQDLVDCADKALYKAKETGRNRVALWENAIDTEMLGNAS